MASLKAWPYLGSVQGQRAWHEETSASIRAGTPSRRAPKAQPQQNRNGYQMLGYGWDHQIQAAGLQWEVQSVYVCLLLHERWSVTTDASLGDHMGVHLREGPKGSCVPGSEGKHMVSVSLRISDTEDKRQK